ncbi:uncharacterized protein NFIA_049820 [Aspergillus fischeri NRRL 181]|uniref:Uncharacterized protein n=1 Tax=Neosartorya fischeri (strain ATCC 1020 / DSM 3700 / CBS 544.65 / FGSC A1164 / JCM 1740 / NRRL 181 / WB 181) TaxID=331117 RepID=A1DLH0_NEOFI|nr:conserved hypothetical protein [Aspergillus fischeri NRRL 181]EAW15641.1 conserved hypothetical protein [Aspergillus fischeri NRRL 181]KAG2026109.1 hypothetical protein GB937_002257 [Aspergillus fischeri]
MATAEYFITVKNKTGKTKNYLFFNQEPGESSSVGKIYTNVWIRSPGVPSPNGRADFHVKVANFAICGTTPNLIDYGVVVATSNFAPVELTTNAKKGTVPLMDIVNEGPQFIAPYGETDKDNSFGIQLRFIADSASSTKRRKLSQSLFGEPHPPKNTYSLRKSPIMSAQVINYKAGETVDVTQIGAISTIDFTTAKPGQTVATITHKEDGSYSKPEFSYPEKRKPYA